MLRWIVGSSLKFRYLVVALAAAMMFFGVQQLRHTAIDVFPEFAPPKVEVQTPALGLSANQVEQLVTIPLEQTLNGVPGLDDIRSKSVESLSSIEMIFEAGERSADRAAARGRAHRTDLTAAADVGESALHDPAAVRDEPGHEDRAHDDRPRPRPDRPVDDDLLEDQDPPDARAGRRERPDLGRAHRDAHDRDRSGAAP